MIAKRVFENKTDITTYWQIRLFGVWHILWITIEDK